MTRTEVKQRQGKLFGQATLPEICLDVRQSLNGDSYPWDDSLVDCTLTFLKDILTTWKPRTFPPDEEMDSAVKSLVTATIRYIEEHR